LELAHILVYFVLRLANSRTGGPILTIYTAYDVFPREEVPDGGRNDTTPHFGGKIPENPNFWARVGVFEPKLRNIETCILSKLLYRFSPNFAH